jgi:hypothetical protein
MDWDSILFNISAFIAGLFLLNYGADVFIDHTAIVATRLGISETLVALLTAGAEWEEVIIPFNPLPSSFLVQEEANGCGAIVSSSHCLPPSTQILPRSRECCRVLNLQHPWCLFSRLAVLHRK